MNITFKAVAWVGAYIASIVLVNWLFVAVAPFPTPYGGIYLANIVVGFVFVLRDYAQREIGHKILLATALAGIITYYAAGPELAIASIIAFLVSELVDWGIYSFWNKPLQQRILVSSLIAVPLDTVVFQNLAGYYTPAAFVTEVASKAVGVCLIWYFLKMRSGGTPAPAAV
jgi:queuosine precursor transporter